MPESTATDNRRIAGNTAFLYVRMIVILLVTLYTSRVVLSVLGDIDYGIYSVVGGVVLMFSFLNSSMTSATQRYITFELGRSDSGRLQKVFSASLNIHIILGLVIVLLAETAGLWFINEKLVIPPERMQAARWVFHFSVITFFVNVIQVPYNAVIIAHEKMKIYAYVSIAEAIVKLGMVFLLTASGADKLVTYAFLMLLLQISIRIFYQLYCRKKYAECRPVRVGDMSLYREMAGFAGWNMFGSLAWLMKDQGVNILLNLFFGPVINAARAVAVQVSVSVNGFVTNFQTALNPQITKNYALGRVAEMEKLVLRGLKFSYILLYFISLPLLLNVEYVLGIWLEDVPAYASGFIVLIMADTLLATLFGGPLMTSLSATGRIRTYQLTVSAILLLIVPVAYIFLRNGAEPEAVFYIVIVFTILSGIARFMFAKRLIGFSAKGFMLKVLLPVFLMTACSLPLPLLLRYSVSNGDNIRTFLMLCCISVASTAVAAWFTALDKGEKQALTKMLKDKMRWKQRIK